CVLLRLPTDSDGSSSHTTSGWASLARAGPGANIGVMIGWTTGNKPRVRSASLVRKSTISAHHLQVTLPPGGAHGEDIGLTPSIRSRQDVDLAQQPFGLCGDLSPKKRADVKHDLPVMTARRAVELQQHFGLRVIFGHPHGERGHDLSRQIAVRNGHLIAVCLEHKTLHQKAASQVRDLSGCHGNKLPAVVTEK